MTGVLLHLSRAMPGGGILVGSLMFSFRDFSGEPAAKFAILNLSQRMGTRACKSVLKAPVGSETL